MNCEAYSSFMEASSVAKSFWWRFSLCSNKTGTVKASLIDSDIRNHSTVIMSNKFDTHQDTSERHSSNEEYENFVTTHKEAAFECITTKPRAKCRIPWKSIAIREKIK